jgi:hypothetical protein
MSSAPDHVYLDLFTINNDTTGSAIKTNLKFTETRTNSILDNPSNYFLSVVRFEVDTPAVSLPIFIPALNIDGINNDPNQTCYKVTMGVPSGIDLQLTNVKSVYVQWVPEDQTAPPPANKIVTSTTLGPVIQTFPTNIFGGVGANFWQFGNRVVMYVPNNSYWINVAPSSLANYYITYSGTDLALPQPLKIIDNTAWGTAGIELTLDATTPLHPTSISAPVPSGTGYNFNGTFYLNAPYTNTSYISSQDITTGYYNCYNVKWWLSCVNKAISDCWNLIYAGGTPPTASPLLVSDAGTNQITLLTPVGSVVGSTVNFAQSEYSITSPANNPTYIGLNSSPAVTHSMFFNEPLFNLFSGFPSVYYGNILTSANFDAGSIATINGNYWWFNYYVLPINFQNKNLITISPVVGASSTWVTTGSEYSPVPMWNPISSLVFTSGLLPITLSFTSVPTVSNSSRFDETYTNSGNNAQISNMLSDIQVGLVSGSEYKPSVLYVPAGEYRLIDMNGNSPIFQASFSIAWKTKFGQVIAFKLGAQCGANMKILFRRKRFNLGNLPPYDTN